MIVVWGLFDIDIYWGESEGSAVLKREIDGIGNKKGDGWEIWFKIIKPN